MKYEAMKHQGCKGEKYTADAIGEAVGDSGRTVQRYIRLSELAEELMGYVDENKIPMVVGEKLSYLKAEEQAWVVDAIGNSGMPAGWNMLSVMRVFINCVRFSSKWVERGDGIVRIVALELQDQDSGIFDEIMEVVNRHLNIEYLRIKDEPMLSLPGLEIYPGRRKIYRKVWGEDAYGDESNAIGCHIRNLREKLYEAEPNAPFTIRCVREVGYCFEVDDKV